MKFALTLFTLVIALHVTAGYCSVRVFLNHSPNHSYTDPYRGITRSGDNLEQAILTQIKSAKKSVFVAVQELRLPLIAQALIDKHKEGVDVRIVLENNYNFDTKHQRDTSGETEHEATRINDLIAFVDVNKNRTLETKELETRDAIYMLKKAKVKIIDDTSGGSAGSALMHHKFVVVDERVTIVSSANFTMSCIHGDVLVRGSKGNANSLMVIGSTQISDIFVEEFMEMWKAKSFGQKKRFRGPKTVNVGGMKMTVQFSPTSRTQSWNNSVNGLIGRTLSKATRSVKGALFVFSDQQLANVLEPKAKSGVEVGMLIEKMFAFRSYSELLDMMGLELADEDCVKDPGNHLWAKPIKEGAMVTMGAGDMLHHKFAVVDNKAVIMGSQNWTESANYQNDETLLVVEDSSVANVYLREYNRLKSQSTMGVPDFLLRKIKDQNSRCKNRR